MPYEWIAAPEGPSQPIEELHLWPYRSLPRRSFVRFIGATALLLSLPLLAVLGTPVLWGLLPFLVGALAFLWVMLARSYRDGEVLEELVLAADRVALTRHDPRRATRHWDANPHWVRVLLHPRNGPVPNYVTLAGAGREVEIGAFLSEDERLALYDELSRRLPARP